MLASFKLKTEPARRAFMRVRRSLATGGDAIAGSIDMFRTPKQAAQLRALRGDAAFTAALSEASASWRDGGARTPIIWLPGGCIIGANEHAKALMCVRCVAYPLRACPTSFPRGDLSCRRCGAADETLEHVFFECEHSKPLRVSDRFSPLFNHPPPSAAVGGDNTAPATTTTTTTLRKFITQPSQYKLAAFIHACFQLWNTDTPQPTQTS